MEGGEEGRRKWGINVARMGILTGNLINGE